MYFDEDCRGWEGPFRFDATAVSAYAPDLQGVYQILYRGERGPVTAYIGIATGDTIRGRLSKHVGGRGNWALARLSDPSRFEFVYYLCDAESARQLESHVVTRRKPPFNVRPEYRDYIESIALH